MKATLRSKKGISEIIAYVLLISMTIALSVIVYAWLKNVPARPVDECPDDVNLIVSAYECKNGTSGYIDISLKNKGLHTINGFSLKAHDSPNATFGIYDYGTTTKNLKPGETFSKRYSLKSQTITFLEIQPFVDGTKTRIPCSEYTTMKITCS